MDGVELYPRLEAETGVDVGWHQVGTLHLASSPYRLEALARQAGWAKSFGLPVEIVSASEALERFPLLDVSNVLGAQFVPTDGHLDPTGLTMAFAEGAKRGGARIRTGCARGGDPRPGRPGDRRRHRPGLDRGRGRGERRRDLGARARAARRRRDPRGADGAPVPDHAADRRRRLELPDAAGSGQPRVRPRGGRRARRRRLRAQPGPVARRHADPARLQPPAARGAVGAVRADRGGRVQPDPRAAHDRDQPLHQRSRGVHPRRRLHPGRDRGPGLLRGGGLLRPRHHRWRRRRPVHRRVDRRRRALDGPVEDGRPAVRRALPEPSVRARARPRDLREALRREVPGRGLPGGPPAQGLAHLRAPRGARGRVRREGRLGARELVPLQRGSRVRRVAAAGMGRRALVDGDRGRARRDARARGAVRRVELRQARGLGSAGVRVPPADLRERRRRGRAAGSSTRRCSTAAAASSATSR